MELKNITCQNCGAQLTLDKDSTTCAFCGSTYINEDSAQKNRSDIYSSNRVFFVKALIDQKRANLIISNWISRGFWKPFEFKKNIKDVSLSQVYVPIIVFDVTTRTEWTGENSETLYRTVDKIEYVQNPNTVLEDKSVPRHYTTSEPYTVYHTVNGTHEGIYKQFISASKLILQDEIEKFQFSNDDFDPLSKEEMLISKSKMESPTIFTEEALKDAKKQAQDIILKKEGSVCATKVGHLSNWETIFYFKNIYLAYIPIWIYVYEYNKKNRRVLINGKNGAAFGKKPISILKPILAVAIAAFIVINIFYPDLFNQLIKPNTPVVVSTPISTPVLSPISIPTQSIIKPIKNLSKSTSYKESSEWNKAILFYKDKNYDKAIVWFKKVQSKYGKKASIYKYLGNCEYFFNNADGAIEYYEKYIGLNPDDSNFKKWLNTYKKENTLDNSPPIPE
jgi:tetratricopeptide (TPR) repeat protein